MPRLTLTIIFTTIVSCCCLATAVAAPTKEDPSVREPIHIEADRMESDQQKESVFFVGNVEATQGDLTIQAAQMTVRYRKTGEADVSADNAAKQISTLYATGNVKIIKNDWLATGDHIEFETEGRKVTISGNTKVWQGNSTVSGDKAVLYLDEGKSVFEDQSRDQGGRVKAFFYPEADETRKNEK